MGCACPLIEPLCFVALRLSAPQLVSEPHALSQSVNPQQSWTTASLRLVSVQTKFGGPGIMTRQALSELLHRDITGMNPGFVGKTGRAKLSRNKTQSTWLKYESLQAKPQNTTNSDQEPLADILTLPSAPDVSCQCFVQLLQKFIC